MIFPLLHFVPLQPGLSHRALSASQNGRAQTVMRFHQSIAGRPGHVAAPEDGRTPGRTFQTAIHPLAEVFWAGQIPFRRFLFAWFAWFAVHPNGGFQV